MEIERKFLIKKLPDLSDLKSDYIEQGYLSYIPEVRVRRKETNGDNKFYLTVKSEGDIAREEFETEISERVYQEMCQKIKGIILKKRRYKIPLNRIDIAELDIYENFNGLQMVEVEFKDRESEKYFEVPDWFGLEVTYDKNFKNKNLVKIRMLK